MLQFSPHVIAGLRIAIENGDYTGMTQMVGNALESVTIARHPISSTAKSLKTVLVDTLILGLTNTIQH
jgi:phosphopantothenate synthetase